MDSFAVIKALVVIILVASSQWCLTCAQPIEAEELACIGESKVLSCRGSGINYTRLSIRRANQPINEKPGKYRWSQDGALVVENIQKEDDGFYFYYKIENQIQIYKCVVKLRVNCQYVHATSGSTASIPCHVDAKPEIQNAAVTWKKETTTGYLTLVDKGKLTNSYDRRLKLSRGGVVTVYKVNTNDSGVYMCQVMGRQVRLKRFFVTLNVTDGTPLPTMSANTGAASSSLLWPSLSTLSSGSSTNQSVTNAVNSTMKSSGASQFNCSHLLLTQTLNVVLLVICYIFI